MARGRIKKWSLGSTLVITLVCMSGWCYAGDMFCKMHPGSICTCPEFCKLSFPAQPGSGDKGHDSCQRISHTRPDKSLKERTDTQSVRDHYCWLINPDCGGPLRTNKLFAQPDTLLILPAYANTSPTYQFSKFFLDDLILPLKICLEPPSHPPESIS